MSSGQEQPRFHFEVPEGPFVTIYPNGNYDGPFDPADAHLFEDGSVGFAAGGLPRVYRIVEQNGLSVIDAEVGPLRFELVDLERDFA